jgi:hypothetical protein
LELAERITTSTVRKKTALAMCTVYADNYDLRKEIASFLRALGRNPK